MRRPSYWQIQFQRHFYKNHLHLAPSFSLVIPGVVIRKIYL